MATKPDKTLTLMLLLLLLNCMHHPCDGEPNSQQTTTNPSDQPSGGVKITSSSHVVLGHSVMPPKLLNEDATPEKLRQKKRMVTLENIPRDTEMPNVLTPPGLQEKPGLSTQAPAKKDPSGTMAPTDQSHTGSLGSLAEAEPESTLDQFFNSSHTASAGQEISEGNPAGRPEYRTRDTTAFFNSSSYSSPSYDSDSMINSASFTAPTKLLLHGGVNPQPRHSGFGNPVNETWTIGETLFPDEESKLTMTTGETLFPDEESELTWTTANHFSLDDYTTSTLSTPTSFKSTTGWNLENGGRGLLSWFQERCGEERRRRRQGQPESCDGAVWGALARAQLCQRECFLCICQKDCYKDETCCLDRVIKDHFSTEQNTTDCHSNLLTPFRRPTHFAMVDHCPPAWGNDLVSDSCSNVSSEDVDSRWPVWSPVTNLTYRNVHCGQCQGQERDHLQPWDLTVFCSYATKLEAFTSLQDAMTKVSKLQNCALGFNPPIGSSFLKCSPQKPDNVEQITCPSNTSFQNKTNHRRFNKVCDVFFGEEPQTPSIITERNLACGLCSVGIQGETCLTDVDIPFPIVMVLSARALQEVTSSQAGSACGCADGEMYDSYETRCRKLYCSTARIAEDSVRVPTVTKLKGVGYELNLRLTPDTRSPNIIDDTFNPEDYALKVYSEFTRQTAVDWFQTTMFQVVIRREYSESKFNTEEFITLKEMDIKIRTSLKELTDIEDAEGILLAVTKSSWNFTSTVPKDRAVYQVVPVFPGQSKAKHYHKEAQSTKSTHHPIFSNGTFSDFAVNVHDILMLSSDEYVAEFHPVQYTLNCTQVSFNLSASSAQVEESFRNYSNPLMDRVRDWRERENRFRHSLHRVTGNVLLSVDRVTGDVYHVPSEHTVTFQYVQLKEEDNTVLVCADQLYGRQRSRPSSPLILERFFSSRMIYMSITCQSLSVLCLLLVLVTYSLFAELRTLPGKNTMGLVISLLASTLLFQLGVSRVEIRALCVALGVAIHFSLLSSFTWMGLCSLHMYRVFTHVLTTRHLRQPQSQASIFSKHVIISLLLPFCIVGVTVLGNVVARPGNDGRGDGDCVTDELDWGYGRGICYVSNTLSLILASVVPICVGVGVNLVLFLFTVTSLRHLNHEARKATHEHRQQLSLYFRMSTLTGINWLAGVAIAIIDHVIVWYVFIILGGLQGLYVFVAFVCNQRVLSLYRELFRRRKEGRSESVPEIPETQGTPIASSAEVETKPQRHVQNVD